MGFQGGILGSPLYCEGNKVVARNKQKALSMTIYSFSSNQGQPTFAHWQGDCVMVQTDKKKAFLVKDPVTISEI